MYIIYTHSTIINSGIFFSIQHPNHSNTSIHWVRIQKGKKARNLKLVLNQIQAVWFQEIVIYFALVSNIFLIIVTHCEQLGWMALDSWRRVASGNFEQKWSMFYMFIYFNFSIHAYCLHVTMLALLFPMMANPILVLWSSSTRFAHVCLVGILFKTYWLVFVSALLFKKFILAQYWILC